MYSFTDIEDLLGKTFNKVWAYDNEEVHFETDDYRIVMYHSQSCCELVYLDDICGDLSDLEDSPIICAEERTDIPEPESPYEYVESETWTFYEIATIKGSVTFRWYGTSNGYYSESVDFKKELK